MHDLASPPDAAGLCGAAARRSATAPLVGILALQGAYAEHAAVLERLGARTRELRAAGDLGELDDLGRPRGLDAVVIPGGESTSIRKGLARTSMYEPLRALIAGGLPTMGTCAGLIVLALPEADGAPPGFGLLDVVVSRNGYGSQVHSFEARVQTAGPIATSCDEYSERPPEATIPGVFIRAPRLLELGEEVTPIAWIAGGPHDGEVVAVRQGSMIAATFHPELTADTSVHELLLDLVARACT